MFVNLWTDLEVSSISLTYTLLPKYKSVENSLSILTLWMLWPCSKASKV